MPQSFSSGRISLRLDSRPTSMMCVRHRVGTGYFRALYFGGKVEPFGLLVIALELCDLLVVLS